MKKTFAILLMCSASFALAACQPASVAANGETSQLTYTKDPRTELCFAWGNPGMEYAVMSEVPCSPSVMAQVQGLDR